MRYFRVYYEAAGGHVHTRWFAGPNPDAEVTMACCGYLRFEHEEWKMLESILCCSYHVSLIDETKDR